ncbi:MAG: Gfo/Idh/MocA family oxidoreductase [Gammaproteobacteria bacterium]|jgi:predicted dehydrogenase
MNKIKVGVIGVGSLGQHHARIYASMPEVELVGIVDTDGQRAKNIANKLNTIVFDSADELLNKVDAVNIVTPTPLHFSIAKFAIEKKVHCLVEKPITVTLDEADELIRLAEAHNVLLQVGHIERFNPAIIEAHQHITHPKFIEVDRLGPYSPRMSHIGVVLDLMVHDLDMLLYFTRSEVVSIDAVGTKVFSDFADIANVRIKFANGCVANVSASRVSLKKLRKIRVFQDDAYISLNFEKQNLKIYKKKKEKLESLKDIKIMRPRIKKNEPLLLELKDFVNCVIEKSSPLVCGVQGRNALELALEVSRQISI